MASFNGSPKGLPLEILPAMYWTLPDHYEASSYCLSHSGYKLSASLAIKDELLVRGELCSNRIKNTLHSHC